MITTREIEATKLSATKKDFYQIWNELMEVANSLATNWWPDSTNESDPGIVLLKVLTAIADKLNYNIDKNILEAFMPSAAQEESMRKLCSMLGYIMKYHISATTEATITFKSSSTITWDDLGYQKTIYFPKYINLKDEDETVNYVTIEDFTLSELEDSRKVKCIEGQLVECESNNDNIITAVYLDDNYRYYLPETGIAENGIFITNASDTEDGDIWKKVDNLNYQALGSKNYSVNYDSLEAAPYIQFPADIDELIEDGLRIKYIRTNGAQGNIIAKKLTKLEIPSIWATADESTYGSIKNLTADNFKVTNISAAMNGSDKESIDEAYNNYKKIIGTFDTLVTCRDYMNKIYMATVSDVNTTPLVSNIIVSDYRDDINKSITLCSFGAYGISYKNVPALEDSTTAKPLINHFDLVLYPFKTIYGLNTYDEYVNSFKETTENSLEIEQAIADTKCISHNIVYPSTGDLVCIKQCLKLNVKVTTTRKITSAEELSLLSIIYSNIYNKFNLRKLDFGVAIPEESIKQAILDASPLVKSVEWNTPEYCTAFRLWGHDADYVLGTDTEAEKIFNKLALRNILAGRISAFEYDERFASDFEHSYAEVKGPDKTTSQTATSILPIAPGKITELESVFNIPNAAAYTLEKNEVVQFRLPNLQTTITYPSYVNYYIKLNSNTSESNKAIPATFKTLGTYLNTQYNETTLDGWNSLYTVADYDSSLLEKITIQNFSTTKTSLTTLQKSVRSAIELYGALWVVETKAAAEVKTKEEGGKTTYIITYKDLEYNFENNHIDSKAISTTITEEFQKRFQRPSSGDDAYIPTSEEIESLEKGEKITISWDLYYLSLKDAFGFLGTLLTADETNLYKRIPASLTRNVGKFVDNARCLYSLTSTFVSDSVVDDPNGITSMYVPEKHSETKDGEYTKDGLGKDAVLTGIEADSEYQLKDGEYLYINYTQSTDSSDSSSTGAVINTTYNAGTIIKANFNLVDSQVYHSTHSWQKTSGYTFNNIDGMFSLGSNQQIEIREPVKLELAPTLGYVYWIKQQSEDFLFDESSKDSEDNYIYTLKDGEYFFYTDAKKLDLEWFGSGTKLKRAVSAGNIAKDTTTQVAIEDIFTYGDPGIIPWVGVNLSKNTSSGIDRRLFVYESQYITLTEGYTIDLSGAGPTSGSSWNNWTTLDSDQAKKIKYCEPGKDLDNATDIQTLPVVNIKDLNWELRTRLDFNLGPDIDQPLNEHDVITVKITNSGSTEKWTLVGDDGSAGSEESSSKRLILNANYLCQLASDKLEISVDDLLIRTSRVTQVTAGNIEVPLDNYGGKYTKLTWSSIAKDTATSSIKKIKLNLALQAQTNYLPFGLFMIYYKKDTDTSAINSPLKMSTSKALSLKLFKDAIDDSGYVSKIDGNSLDITDEGMYIIALKYNGSGEQALTIFTDVDSTDTIVFSHVKIVTGINSKLDYRGQDRKAALAQLLLDLRGCGYADKFYFSVDVENSNAMNINQYDDSETLSSPQIWFDKNNINNKFVVEEINPDYLLTGISLTKASRR